MLNQKDNVIRERGGVPFKDYTKGGSLVKDRTFEEKTGSGTRRPFFYALSRVLAAASFGLGLAEVFWPRRVQKLVGVRGKHKGLIRAMGVREILSGVLVLWRPRLGVWTRVAGDALDLAALASAFGLRRTRKNRLRAATAAIAGITALDVLTAVQLSRRRKTDDSLSTLTQRDLSSRTRGGAFHVSRTIEINTTPEALYQYWRNFENLPNFMYHLRSVRVMDSQRSHWIASAPAGKQVEWDAQITEDQPNSLIAWHSVENADVPNSGIVRFLPAAKGRGTVLHVEIEYRPPAGALGRTVAKLFGEEPDQQVDADLHRLKQVIETGEVTRSDGSPEGYGQKMQRPAQPLPGGHIEPAPRRQPERQVEREWVNE